MTSHQAYVARGMARQSKWLAGLVGVLLLVGQMSGCLEQTTTLPASPGECSASLPSLASEIPGGPHACTAVIRIEDASFVPTGFQLVCGPYLDMDDGALKEVVREAAYDVYPGLRQAENVSYRVFHVLPPGDEARVHILRQSIEPGRQVLTIVSSDTGLLLLNAELVHTPLLLDVHTPATWRAPRELSAGCPRSRLPYSWGYNLISNTTVVRQEVVRALEPVLETGLMAAMESRGSIFGITVLKCSDFDSRPEERVWFVLVSGGGST